MKKKVICLLCVLALVLSGINSQGVVLASDAETTVSILSTEVGYALNGGTLDVKITKLSDWQSRYDNFFNEEFANTYMEFGEGLDYASFSEGLYQARVLDDGNSIFRFDWRNKGAAFDVGTTFTIKKGARLPYNNTSGGVSYAVLDADYKYTFYAGNSGNYNVVRVSQVKTFSIDANIPLANGKVDTFVCNNINFNDQNVTDYQTIYQNVLTDEYEEYIDFAGHTIDSLLEKGVQMKYILDGGARVLQIGNWGTLRNELGENAQIVFKKGFPITYKNSAGATITACLDADYIYEFSYGNEEHDQVFYGTKYDSQVNAYGFTEGTRVTTEQTVEGAVEQYINVGLTASISVVSYVDDNILEEQIAAPYIHFAGYTVKEAVSMGAVFRFIPGASVVQMAFGTQAVEALQVGDKIVLEKGMPMVYRPDHTSWAITSATLNNQYTFTVTGKEGGQLSLSCAVTEEVFEEDTTVEEFGFATKVTNTFVQGTDLATNISVHNTPFTVDSYYQTTLDSTYIDFSSCEEEVAVKDGCRMKLILADSSTQVLQVLFNQEAVSKLQVGDRIVLQKGMPVPYSATDATAITQLDEDYAIIVLAKTPEKLVLKIELTGAFSLSTDTFYFSNSVMYADIRYTSGGLSDAQNFERESVSTALRDYFVVSGKSFDDLKMRGYRFWEFYVDALHGVRFSCDTFDMTNGDYVVFKKGLPITYTNMSGREKTVYLDKDYGYRYNGQNAFIYDVNINAEDVTETSLVDTGIMDDVNSDEKVNVKDVVHLKRFLTKADILVNMEKADVNIDGLCDNTDYTVLKEILVGGFVPEATVEELADFVVEVESGREPVILQLSDTQIMDSAQARSSSRLSSIQTAYYAPDMMEERCYDYLKQIIEETNPDLILLTGDLIYGEFDDNGTALQRLIAEMEQYQIPWAPVFGNHDNESAMGVDWQCKQLEEAEYCLFKQRTLTGNGNYTVGIKQGDEIQRVFFMMDSNGCGNMSAETLNNGHSQKKNGFAPDQVKWFYDTGKQMRRANTELKVSFAYHIQQYIFSDAYSMYGFVNSDTKNNPIDIDKLDYAQTSDFGYIGRDLKGAWDSDYWVWDKMQSLGTDSLFVGHEHCNSSSVLYEGVRFQFGQKSSTYDRTNYVTSDGKIVGAEAYDYTSGGTPIVGGTVMYLSEEDGSIVEPYIYYYK